MNEEQKTKPSDDLQFDKAVYKDSAAGQSACAVCKSPLPGIYYNINGNVACPDCKSRLEKQFADGGNPAGRVGKALAFGIPAAILGSVIYYAIMALTGYEIGLVAIVIGWMVGAAVRKGSGHRGGLPYQIIAVLLTYVAICSTYIPAIIKGLETSYQESIQPTGQPVSFNLKKDFMVGAGVVEAADAPQDQPAAAPDANAAPQEDITFFQYVMGFAVILLLALAAPFFSGIQNVIGLLIIGFGLWEAWRMNKKTVLDIQGPFEVKS